MSETLRIGIIGASAERGWAKLSHVPAIQQLDGLELRSVVTRNQSSANMAVEAFGAAKGYDDPKKLFVDPEIDIVAVAVNVPSHRGLVLAALAAGKHVYCEYPLGRNVAEAEEMAEAARKAGVHVAIGLQLRANLAAVRAREMIMAGKIGRVLNARVVSSTVAFGSQIEHAMTFAENPENGVTLVSIQGAHTIDLAIALLGEFTDITALASTQFPQIAIAGGAPQHRTTPDHLALIARLGGGAPLSIEVIGGRPADQTAFRFEVIGETGKLVLIGGAPRGVQSGVLRLFLDDEEQIVDAGAVATPESAVNVAGVYKALRDDITSGTRTAPDFDHAVRVTRLIKDVMAASQSGSRVSASDWPCS
ncbi:Gfo/Idh/MocA family protein [uncultured Caballeronia sp.]|uniref:Gfo/Idh/MocA family protein n=1 Tax=uncultured Caballeronia sp. TaxID=1827198 RepID=UPI0035CC4995